MSPNMERFNLLQSAFNHLSTHTPHTPLPSLKGQEGGGAPPFKLGGP
jgi:hypothetical protein